MSFVFDLYLIYPKVSNILRDWQQNFLYRLRPQALTRDAIVTFEA
jgi:hypothetical protein